MVIGKAKFIKERNEEWVSSLDWEMKFH